MLDAIRPFMTDINDDVRRGTRRIIASFASYAVLTLITVVAGAAVAATGAVLLVTGIAHLVGVWVGSSLGGACLVGALGLASPLGAAWLAYRIASRR